MLKIHFFFLLLGLSACANSETMHHKQPIPVGSTKVIAHRGFSGIAPENTLAAFQKAVEIKADYFELDVHETKDGELVVIHDSKLKRTTSNGGSGKVEEMTLAELSKQYVGFSKKFGEAFKNEKIPTLKEALQVAKGKIKVCIEIKVLGVEEKVMDLVKELNMHDEVMIFSFHSQALTKIREIDKTVPILFLITYANKRTIEYANLINANAIGVGYATHPSKEYIAYAHSKGVEVWKWTINKESQMKKMIAVGLDGIITNYPDKALDLIGKNR